MTRRMIGKMVRLNASIHPSLSEMVTEVLRRRNVITIVDFVAADLVQLATCTGLSHTDISQVKQHILKKFGGTKWNAIQLLQAELNGVISTGVMCLDELLRGGLCLGQLCELCGSSSSGKTQLCMTIAANVGATQPDVVAWYFDTKRDFSRSRFEGILKARKFTQRVVEEALRRTRVCHLHSARELIHALRRLVILCKTEQNSAPIEEKRLLVIIDSLPAVIFKVTRLDNETTYELDDLAETCRFLAKECRAAVVTVNSVTRWNSPTRTDLAVVTPALGKYWMRIPATRLLLTRQRDEIRRIAVWKDLRSDSENSSCIVTVDDVGVTPR